MSRERIGVKQDHGGRLTARKRLGDLGRAAPIGRRQKANLTKPPAVGPGRNLEQPGALGPRNVQSLGNSQKGIYGLPPTRAVRKPLTPDDHNGPSGTKSLSETTN